MCASIDLQQQEIFILLTKDNFYGTNCRLFLLVVINRAVLAMETVITYFIWALQSFL